MKSANPQSPATAKPANKSKAKLYLVPAIKTLKEAMVSKSQAGDMDMLERYAEKPMAPVFEHIEKTYKSTRTFFGIPLPLI